MTVGPCWEAEQARRCWDVSSRTYDEAIGHGRVTAAEEAVWAGLFARLLDPERQRRVLDVGTGTGFVALLLAERGHEVTGIDYSEPMLATAQRKAAERGLPVTFRLADAYTPGLDGHMFDAVVCRHVLWILDRPERAVRTWAELVKPGGLVIAVEGFFWSTAVTDRAAKLLGDGLRFARTRSWPRPLRQAHEQPLRWATTLSTAGNIFARAGLVEVRTELLESIDHVERSVMTLEERLRCRWRRYLVEGTAPSKEASR